MVLGTARNLVSITSETLRLSVNWQQSKTFDTKVGILQPRTFKRFMSLMNGLLPCPLWGLSSTSFSCVDKQQWQLLEEKTVLQRLKAELGHQEWLKTELMYVTVLRLTGAFYRN